MTKFTKYVGGFIAALAIFGLAAQCSGDGIIALDGYPHAVIICGEGMTVNQGHYEDPQVDQLIELANKECAKWEARTE